MTDISPTPSPTAPPTSPSTPPPTPSTPPPILFEQIFRLDLPDEMREPPIGFRLELHDGFAVLALPWRQPGGDLIVLPGEIIQLGLGSDEAKKGRAWYLKLSRGKFELASEDEA